MSMLEVHDESIRDLLPASSEIPKGGLKVLQSKPLAIHVDGLSRHAVITHQSIVAKLSDGLKKRTTTPNMMCSSLIRFPIVIIIEVR
jgi:hypothetical protein